MKRRIFSSRMISYCILLFVLTQYNLLVKAQDTVEIEGYGKKPVIYADGSRSGMGIILNMDPVHSYLYKGEKRKILSYSPFNYSDNNGDTIMTETSGLCDNFNNPVFKEKRWCSLQAFPDPNTSNIHTDFLFGPFQYFGAEIFADASELIVGETDSLWYQACNEPSAGPISVRVCAASNWRFVHVIPYPIDLISVQSENGSAEDLQIKWKRADVHYWHLHHYAIVTKEGDSIYYNDLPDVAIVRDSIGLSDTTIFYHNGIRDHYPFYAVIGYDSLGEVVAFSQSRRISYDTSSFSLVYPKDGAKLNETSVTFEWEQAGDSLYSLELSVDSAFLNPVIFDSIDSNVFVMPYPLNDHTEYFWKVSTGSGTFSNETGWSFSVNEINLQPSSFNLLIPEDDALVNKKKPLFKWSSSNDPGDTLLYAVLISQNLVFSDTVMEYTTRQHFFIPTQDLVDDTVYYWKVLVRDSEGLENQSAEINSFHLSVDDRPGGFTLIYPLFCNANGPVETSLSPTFTWHPSINPNPGGTVTYNLFYSVDSTMDSGFEVIGLTDTTYIPIEPLMEDSLYYWKVQAVSNTGRSRWNYGMLHAFVTNTENREPGPAKPRKPEYGRTFGPGDTAFEWDRPDDDYQDYPISDLQYSLDSTFATDSIIKFIQNRGIVVSIPDTGTYYWRLLTHSKRVPLSYLDTARQGGTSTGPVWKFKIGSSFISNLGQPWGGELWRVNSRRKIIWDCTNVDSLLIEYTSDGGNTWNVIDSAAPAVQMYYWWKIPNEISDRCLVRISSVDDPSIWDISDHFFSIVKYPVWYVSTTGNDITGKGTAEEPFRTIQKAVNVSANGDSIRVAAGRYHESVIFPDANPGYYLTGGYNPLTWERDFRQYKTILDPGPSNNGIRISTGNPLDSMVVDGFCIKNAQWGIYKNFFPSVWMGYIRNCEIDSCMHGVHLEFSGAFYVENVLFSNCDYGCYFFNTIYLTIKNCIFHNISNKGFYSYKYDGHLVTIENSVFSHSNTGIYMRDYGNPGHKIINSIFYECQSGIDYPYCSDMLVLNNNFFDNGNNYGFCSVDTSNFYLDPLFIDAPGLNYMLRLNSPCIGRGNSPLHPTFDFNDLPRPIPVGTHPDVGAYELPIAEPMMLKYWNGDGSWSDSANWYPTGIPDTFNHCRINSGSCYLGDSVSCATLCVNNGATLTIGESARFHSLNNGPYLYDNQIPVVIIDSVISNSDTTAIIGGIVIDEGSSAVIQKGVCWSTTPNPRLDNNFSIDGIGIGDFTSYLTGLIPYEQYFVRAYATNIYGTCYGSEKQFISVHFDQPCNGINVISYSGQIYHTVEIGSQCWLQENLNVGTMISSFDTMADNGIIEKYCYNNLEGNCSTHGGLYQWNEIMQYELTEGAQGICPPGWHIPTDDEWKILEGYSDTQYPGNDPIWDDIYWRGADAGHHLMSTQYMYGDNSTGFNAMGGGSRWDNNGFFYNLDDLGYYWTSSMAIPDSILLRQVAAGRNDIFRDYHPAYKGYSVRCIKD